MSVDRATVLEKLDRDLGRPASFRELVRVLRVRNREEKRVLKHLLRELTRSGDVVKIRGGRYGLPRKMSLVVGTLKCSPKGYGFVSPAKPGQLDVFVREVDMGGALHGDEVVIRQERHKRDGRVLSTVTK